MIAYIYTVTLFKTTDINMDCQEYFLLSTVSYIAKRIEKFLARLSNLLLHLLV